MQIEYCALCNKRIGDDDFAEAKAFRVNGEPYCQTCKEKLSEPLQNEIQSVAPRRSPVAPEPSRSASDTRQTPGHSSGSHGLKLYWCENCGRRLTNEDLVKGEARDKQVKGIYCKQCAPGVVTLQFDAIKSPLRQDKSLSAAASAVPKTGKISTAHLPVAERKSAKATCIQPEHRARQTNSMF